MNKSSVLSNSKEWLEWLNLVAKGSYLQQQPSFRPNNFPCIAIVMRSKSEADYGEIRTDWDVAYVYPSDFGN